MIACPWGANTPKSLLVLTQNLQTAQKRHTSKLAFLQFFYDIISTVYILIPSPSLTNYCLSPLKVYILLTHSNLNVIVVHFPNTKLRLLAATKLENTKKADTPQNLLVATTGIRPPLPHTDLSLIAVCFPNAKLRFLAPTILEDTNKVDTSPQNASTAL